MPEIKTPMQRSPPRLPVLDVDVRTGVEEDLRWRWTSGGWYHTRTRTWQIDSATLDIHLHNENVPTTEAKAEQLKNPQTYDLNTILLLVWHGHG